MGEGGTSSGCESDHYQVSEGRDGLENGEEGFISGKNTTNGELKEPHADVDASCDEQLLLRDDGSLQLIRKPLNWRPRGIFERVSHRSC